jgi:phosphatidate cytidylyltransferase
VIGNILGITVPGFVLGAFFMARANRGLPRAVANARWLKLIVFFVIVHIVLGVAAAGRPWVTVLVSLIVGAGFVELRSAWQRMSAPRPARVWAVYLAIAATAMPTSWMLAPAVFALLFLITAASDGFSQVVGQLFGHRKLAPKISPAKTVEGLLGGLVAAVAVALLTNEVLGLTTPSRAAALAVATGLAGLAGDLAASWVKRRAGIKDFSNTLPGQGGFLDRFDSLLGALILIGPTLPVLGG